MIVASGPGGGLLTGTASVALSNGIASFSNLIIQKSGNYTLRAVSGGLGLNTSGITVVPAAVKKLVFNQVPTAAVVGANISPAITVDATDAFGNLISSYTGNITLALSSGPSGGTLVPVTVAAVGGEATFGSISLNRAGSYKLKATAPSLTLVTSGAFTITAPA